MFMSGTTKNEPRRGWGAPAAAGRALGHVKGAAMPVGRGAGGSAGSAVFGLAEMSLLQGKKKKRGKNSKTSPKGAAGEFLAARSASACVIDKLHTKAPQGLSCTRQLQLRWG